MSEVTPDGPEFTTDIVGRPLGQLHDFPLNVRWEVTRRHPYYLAFWKTVRDGRRGEPTSHPDEVWLRHAAFLILGMIGVTGEPVSPDASFESLLGEDPAFLAGSVQPMTFRAMLATLIAGLPPADLAFAGALLMNAGSEDYEVPGDVGGAAQKRKALLRLSSTPGTAFDSYPDVPLFFVHLGASGRTITADVEDQVRRWKARRGIGGSKVQKPKLAEYLKVWDLREGWTGGGYDRSRETSFDQVRRGLKLGSVSTVANAYRSAFRLITGHPFSPELWWRIFAPLKLSKFADTAAPADASAGARRFLRSPVRRPVPDSVVSPATAQGVTGGMVEAGSVIPDDVAFIDLKIDFQDLVDRGLDDEEIARKLGLGDSRLVAYLRGRIDDLSSI